MGISLTGLSQRKCAPITTSWWRICMCSGSDPLTTRTLRLQCIDTRAWKPGRANFDIELRRPDGYTISNSYGRHLRSQGRHQDRAAAHRCADYTAADYQCGACRAAPELSVEMASV